jgi:hypothetical protein
LPDSNFSSYARQVIHHLFIPAIALQLTKPPAENSPGDDPPKASGLSICQWFVKKKDGLNEISGLGQKNTCFGK